VVDLIGLPILAAYNEIALKSKYVRSTLERSLASQIGFMLRREGYVNSIVTRVSGRIIIDDVPSEAAQIVAKVFGVVNATPAEETDSSLESILALSSKIGSNILKDGDTWAVRARVVGTHPFGSQDLAAKAGEAIINTVKDRTIKVNLTAPMKTIGVEVRDTRAYVFTESFHGVSGLPYGTQGTAVALFSGGIDSPVASWLLMKRGVSVYPLFMDQTPYVGESYLERAAKAFKVIRWYAPTEKFNLYFAPMGPIMERILESPELKFTCILCKRAMYRIAEQFIRLKKGKAIITGESLGQVASQTLDNLYVLDSAVQIPILRPLIGLDKVEIEDMARKIGTYSVTAHKTEGCKVVPSSPATRSYIIKIENFESELGLVELCAETARRIVVKAID
jgi:thiamine biosynthesis protein ThiI